MKIRQFIKANPNDRPKFGIHQHTQQIDANYYGCAWCSCYAP